MTEVGTTWKGPSIRVLVFSWHVPPGGLLRTVSKELMLLPEFGVNPRFVYCVRSAPAYHDGLLMGREARQIGNRLIRYFTLSRFTPRGELLERVVRSGWDVPLLSAISISREIRNSAASVILCHELASAVLARTACAERGLPFIVILHDNPFDFLGSGARGIRPKFPHRIVSSVAHQVLADAAFVVCTTGRIAKALRDNGVTRELEVIPFGSDVAAVNNPIDQRDIVLSVSKWDRKRRPEAYVHVASLLPKGAKLVLIGHWDDPTHLEQVRAAARNSQGGSVEIIDDVSEEALAYHYGRAKVFLRMAFDEVGTGQAVLEAAGFGCPVVIDPSLGASELLLDSTHGFHVESNDLNSVAAHVRMILENDDLASRLSQSSYALAKSLSWQGFAGELARVIRAAVTSNGALASLEPAARVSQLD